MISMLVPNAFCEDRAATRMGLPQVASRDLSESASNETISWEFDDSIERIRVLNSGTTVFVQLHTGSVHRRTETTLSESDCPSLFKAEENSPIRQLILCRDESCLCTVAPKGDNQRGDWSHVLSRFDLNSDMRTPSAELHISTVGTPSFYVTNGNILVTLEERSYRNQKRHVVKSMATFNWEQCTNGNTDAIQKGRKVKARRDSSANAVEDGEVIEVDTESKKFKIRFNGDTDEAGEIDSLPMSRIIQDAKAAPKPRRKWTVCDGSLHAFQSVTHVASPEIGVAIGWVCFKHNGDDLGEVKLVSLPVINFPQRIGTKTSNIISFHLSSNARTGVMHLLGESQVESLEGVVDMPKETLVQIEFNNNGFDSESAKRWSFDSTTSVHVQGISSGGEILAITNQKQLQLAIGGREPSTVLSHSSDETINYSMCRDGSYVAASTSNIVHVYSGRESSAPSMEWKVEDDRCIVSCEIEGCYLAVVTERMNFGCETATEDHATSYQRCERQLNVFRVKLGTSTLQPLVVHPLDRGSGFNLHSVAANGALLLSNEDKNALILLQQKGSSSSLEQIVSLNPSPPPKDVSKFILSGNGARVLGITDKNGTHQLLAFNVAGGKRSVTELEMKWDLKASGSIESVSADGRTIVVGGSSAAGTILVFTANKKDGPRATFIVDGKKHGYAQSRLSHCGKKLAIAYPSRQCISVFDVFTRNVQALHANLQDFAIGFDFALSISNPSRLALVVACKKFSEIHKISLDAGQQSRSRRDLLSCERLRLDNFEDHVACENLSILGLAIRGFDTCSLWTLRDSNDKTPFDAKVDKKRDIVLDSPLTYMTEPINFSGSGSTVVLACQDHTIRVHDSTTLAEWGRFSHAGDIVKHQISQDGSKLMILSYDRTASLFDIAEKRVLRRWEGIKSGNSRDTELSADLSVLMTIENDGKTPILQTFQGGSLPNVHSSFDSVLGIKIDSISQSDSVWLVASELWLPLVGALPAMNTLLYALLSDNLSLDKLSAKAWGHIVRRCPTLPWARDAFSRSPTELVLQGLDPPRLSKNGNKHEKLLLAILDRLLKRTIDLITDDPDRRTGFICAGGPDSSARCIAWLVKHNQLSALTGVSLSGSF
jgi:hypothetical protein